MENNYRNEMKSFLNDTYSDNKLSKRSELNKSMSISNQSNDEYTNTIHNVHNKGTGEG